MNTTPLDEIWKDIPGYESIYQVSNVGRVKRVGRASGATPGTILKPKRFPTGYLYIRLYKDQKSRHIMIHRLVLMAFVGLPPEGYQANHLDFDKANNCLENLEWCTPSQNSQHAHDNGRHPCKGRPKLTVDQVIEIRTAYSVLNITMRELGLQYDVHDETIRQIIRRLTWKKI